MNNGAVIQSIATGADADYFHNAYTSSILYLEFISLRQKG